VSHAAPPSTPPPTAAQAARTSISLNPITVTYAVSTAATLATGFGLHLSRDQTGAIVTGVTGLAAVVSALTSRPWYVAGVTGGATSALAAAAAFGLKLSPETISAGTAALGMILGVLSTGSAVPVAAARAGVTATDVQLGKAALEAPPPPRRPRPRKRRRAPAATPGPVSAAPTEEAPTEVHTIVQPPPDKP
jgi:hypothetical protein